MPSFSKQLPTLSKVPEVGSRRWLSTNFGQACAQSPAAVSFFASVNRTSAAAWSVGLAARAGAASVKNVASGRA
jgi:hypothetical protein